MKYIKLFEDFKTSEVYGEYTYSNEKSYIKYFKMKDTHSIVEFTDMDLDTLYSEVGQECIFIDKVYIHPDDSPLMLRRFLSKVEEYAHSEGYTTIATMADAFEDKRLSTEQLVELYKKFGFITYQKVPESEAYIMYKDI
jgi:hypothetical protein